MARFVRQRRLSLGMDQADLAAAAGVGRSAITRLEGGAISLTLEHAYDLAHALGLTLDELCRGVSPEGVPLRREIVERPDELAFLDFWRGRKAAEKFEIVERMRPELPSPKKRTRE